MREFRLSFLLSLCVFAALSFGLYLVKYEVQDLHDALAIKHVALQREQEAMRLLHAEWAYLTRPERLQRLQARHVKLHPLVAEQTVPFDFEGYVPAQAVVSNVSDRTQGWERE